MSETASQLSGLHTGEERAAGSSRHVPEHDIEQAAVLEGAASPAAQEDTIVVLDFGSQYSRLIARRIREAQVYCEIRPHDTPWPELAALAPKGFVLSGGPSSV